jgi:hypothetical protein
LNTAAMPVQIMLLFGHPLTEWPSIWAKLTDFNRVVMVLSPLAAVGSWLVCRWGWWAVMALLTAALINNAILLPFPTPVPREAVLLSSVLALGTGGWLLRPTATRLFRERQLHWWKTPPRYTVKLPVEVASDDGVPTPSRLVNISRTGALIEIGNQKLSLGDTVDLTIRFRQRVIRCAATVARQAAECAFAPAGYGLQFQEVGVVDRVWLRTRLGRQRSA